MKKTPYILTLLLALSLASCNKPKGYGNLSVGIDYSVNGSPLMTDSLCYHNEADNAFMITEIQWFLSKMELQNEQGDWIALNRIFYIDTNIPESQRLQMDSIPIGHYKALRFTFGLDEEDNLSGRYSDPPESNMFWPESLGGGYHYMKLNGRYFNTEGELAPLNIHLGIGQNADHTVFYQNYFTVEGPIDLDIAENKENQIQLTMIVDNWFRNPNLYDFNVYGSAIMQNQAAQQVLRENGQDVFTWSTTEELNEKNMNKEEIVEQFNSLMKRGAPKPHFWSWNSVRERISPASRHCEEERRSNPG
jgi:hypothetical protein